MKFLYIILLVFSLSLSSNRSPKYTHVEKDSVGLAITFKEKYGTFMFDTGTVLVEDSRTYVLIRRDWTKKIIMKSNLVYLTWKKLSDSTKTSD